MSFTLTLVALTYLWISKSQIGFATVVLFALLLDSFESGVVVFTTTKLVLLPSTVILVMNLRTIGSALAAKSPSSQIMVLPVCLPLFGNSPITITPVGKVSLTITSFAVLGPLFTTVMVHSTVSLTKMLDALTSLITTKSQISFTVVLLFAVLLSV